MNKQKRPTFSYGSVIVASCFSLQAVGIGSYVAFGVFFNPLIAEFGWTRATLSGASSLAFFLSGLLGILVGRLNDRVGPRVIVLVCGCLFALGHVLMSGVGSVWQLYLFWGVILGVGLSSVDVIALSTIARWFSKNRGTVTGIVKVGTGFGQFTIPLAASLLIAGYGWRASYVILGGAALVLLMAIGLMLRRDPPRSKEASQSERSSPEATGDTVDRGDYIRDALRGRAFWTICAANLSSVFCLMTILVHMVPHAREIMDTPTKAAGVLSTIGAVSIGGRIITGLAIDRIGTKRSTVFCFLLLTLVLLWLQVADEPWMLVLFALFYGVVHGGFFTIISPIVADYFGIKAHGFLFGIVAFCGTVGGSVGPFLSGHIFDVTGTYHMAFWVCTVMSVLGLLLMLTLKDNHKWEVAS
ncbi:MAG: MFS transporter [Deltaproteobacteria bacterium]|nr:MFS transporter [Deltaproteobacteria bacterium]